MSGIHPILKEAEEINIMNVKKILLNYQFVKLDSCSYLTKKYYGKFPRLLLHIHDPDIKQLSLALNTDYYDQVKNQRRYTQTLDNIMVKQVSCYCENNRAYHKTQFEKILGKNVPDQQEILCYAPCRHTIFAAAKRQIKSAPTPNEDVAIEFIQFSKDFIDKYLGESLNNFGYSYSDWYNHLTHDKQINMDRVVQYLNHSLDEDLDPYTIERYKDVAYEGICKIELQDPDGKPRMVCAIPDIIKYTLGPVTWHLEEIFAESLPGYCGGKNLTEMSNQLNEYIDQGFTKILEGDGSSFDNTQDVMLKEIDRYIFKRVRHAVYHVSIELYDEYSQAYYKKMKIKDRDPRTGELKTIMTYYVLGTVFSGDCDTTLSNTTRMSLYIHFVNYKMGLILFQTYIVISKGDDFTALYPPHLDDEKIKDGYYKYFLPKSDSPDVVDDRQYGLGQVLKFITIGDQSTFTFCSLRSWIIDECGHIALTRDPKKLYNLSKYSRKTKTYNSQQRYQYHISQAIAYKASYQGIHVFDVIAQAHLNEAYKLLCYETAKGKSLYFKSCKNIIKDNRIHIDVETPLEEYYNPKLLDFVKHRVKQYKIYGTYWETMQMIERVNTHTFTQSELQYINQQIDSEFDPNELKAVLA